MSMPRHAPDPLFILLAFRQPILLNLVPLTWIEHVASPLPRECSTTELQGPFTYAPTAAHTKTGAGEGNRTLVISLEGFSSTIELHPPGATASAAQLTFGGGGWIRTSVLVRGQIYSLLPLTTRPPLRKEPRIIAPYSLRVNPTHIWAHNETKARFSQNNGEHNITTPLFSVKQNRQPKGAINKICASILLFRRLEAQRFLAELRKLISCKYRNQQ